MLMHCVWKILRGQKLWRRRRNTTGQKLVTMKMTTTTTTTTMKTFTLKAINLNGRHCLAFAQRPKIARPQTFCIHFTIDCYRTLYKQNGMCSRCVCECNFFFFLVCFLFWSIRPKMTCNLKLCWVSVSWNSYGPLFDKLMFAGSVWVCAHTIKLIETIWSHKWDRKKDSAEINVWGQ